MASPIHTAWHGWIRCDCGQTEQSSKWSSPWWVETANGWLNDINDFTSKRNTSGTLGIGIRGSSPRVNVGGGNRHDLYEFKVAPTSSANCPSTRGWMVVRCSGEFWPPFSNYHQRCACLAGLTSDAPFTNGEKPFRQMMAVIYHRNGCPPCCRPLKRLAKRPPLEWRALARWAEMAAGYFLAFQPPTDRSQPGLGDSVIESLGHDHLDQSYLQRPMPRKKPSSRLIAAETMTAAPA